MRILAGPWAGEFGWEIFSWQGYVRKFARAHPDAAVIVSAPRGHAALYQDFATEFIALPHHALADRWQSVAGRVGVGLPDVRETGALYLRPSRPYAPAEQTFIQFGRAGQAQRFDVVFHFRERPHVTARNYTRAAAEALVAQLHSKGLLVACIGRREASFAPLGAEDLRGQPLQDDMDVLASARLAAGPSSGPMHLASFCGCPHLVWGDRHWNAATGRGLREAYAYRNPFDTRMTILEDGWQPPPACVVFKIMEMLAKTKTGGTIPA